MSAVRRDLDARAPTITAIWHDLECGGYSADLALWRSLAAEHGDPVLEVGAGTGRVALDLARRGHRVSALERDPALLAELQQRARGLELQAVLADARSFDLDRRFALCLVPMQTIQLLGGSRGRAAFLRCAARHLHHGGVLVAALADKLEPFERRVRAAWPPPDRRELDGVLYSSRPTAVRADRDGFVLERHREMLRPGGVRSTQEESIRIDTLQAAQLEDEALAVGLLLAGRASIPPTREYAGSTVVILHA
ncbi:MAG: class I SAM-dependent methyltransferase [Solirubrobacteraceae bacterium]